MKVTVFNSHSSAIAVGRHVFPPRRMTDVDVDQGLHDELLAHRHLALYGPETLEGDGSGEALPEADEDAYTPDVEPVDTFSASDELDIPERCDHPGCTYEGTVQQVRAHKLSHRGQDPDG